MSASTVEVPQDVASQEAYFERNKEWAVSGANWNEMGNAFVHRINVAMGLGAFAALAGATGCADCAGSGCALGIRSANVRCDGCGGTGFKLPEIVFSIDARWQ